MKTEVLARTLQVPAKELVSLLPHSLFILFFHVWASICVTHFWLLMLVRGSSFPLLNFTALDSLFYSWYLFSLRSLRGSLLFIALAYCSNWFSKFLIEACWVCIYCCWLYINCINISSISFASYSVLGHEILVVPGLDFVVYDHQLDFLPSKIWMVSLTWIIGVRVRVFWILLLLTMKLAVLVCSGQHFYKWLFPQDRTCVAWAWAWWVLVSMFCICLLNAAICAHRALKASIWITPGAFFLDVSYHTSSDGDWKLAFPLDHMLHQKSFSW